MAAGDDISNSDTQSNNHFLHNFFYPDTVAIVGATKNAMKINYQLVENNVRLNFRGRVIPINPNSDEIAGLKAYKSLKDVPEKIDVVVVSIPAHKCIAVIRECIDLGIKQIVMVTGGFSEGDSEGEKRTEEIERLIRENNLHIIGPNTLSPVNAENNFAVSFHHLNTLKRGGISFVFQSGLYEYKLNWINAQAGVNKVLDLGNKMDVNEVDALEYLGSDSSTKVIAMHVESIRGDGREFNSVLKKTTKIKPVIILKSGRTAAGSRAAASHTGSLATENDALFDGLIKQSGAVRAHNLEYFFDLAKTFAFLKPPAGNRVAVITLSGGEGVIATDACEMHGLQLADFSQKSYAILKEIFPPWEVPLNPFDSGVCFEFHTDDFENALNKLTAIPEDDGVDCVIMQLPTTVVERVKAIDPSDDALIRMMDFMVKFFLSMKESGKPFCLWRSAMDETETEFVRRIEAQSIPVYPSQERSARAMAALYRYSEYMRRNNNR
jgi:acyl-CoA synthetase (NDP forming)